MDKPWKVISAFIGVFIAGSIFGGLLALRFDLSRHRTVKRPGPGDAPFLPQLTKRFVERLDLTTEQQEQLRPVMERTDADLRRLRQTGFKETGIVLERLQQDVAKVLTPEQRLKLEAMREEMRRRIHRERGPRSDRRGPPMGEGVPGRSPERPAGAPAEK